MLLTLLKKEFKELFKTKTFLILPIVIISFSAISPLLAYFIQDILKAILPPEQIEPIIDSLPTQSIRDAYTQLLSNLNQIGYLVLLFFATSIFISDKTKGRLLLILAKPIKRSDILISKFLNILIQYILALLIGSAFFIFYTYALFDEFDVLLYLSVISLHFLYGLFLIAIAMFASTVTKSYMASILISVLTFMGLGIFNFIDHNLLYIIPNSLNKLQLNVISGTYESIQIIISLVSVLAMISILVTSSVVIFKHQEIE